jgi:hypothetical protein
MAERTALESEIIRKCLSRSELQCSFLEYRGYKVIYRRYASLFFIVGTKPSPDEEENQENELGMLEFIHTLVETMDRWAGSICELDIMYSVSRRSTMELPTGTRIDIETYPLLYSARTSPFPPRRNGHERSHRRHQQAQYSKAD